MQTQALAVKEKFTQNQFDKIVAMVVLEVPLQQICLVPLQA